MVVRYYDFEECHPPVDESNESDDDDDDGVESVYFDAACSIPSLSTASFGSSSQPTTEEEEGTNDNSPVNDDDDDSEMPIPSHVNVVTVVHDGKAEDEGGEGDDSSTNNRSCYYLNVSDIVLPSSEVTNVVVAVDGKSYFVASDRSVDASSLRRVMDALVDDSLRLSTSLDDNEDRSSTTGDVDDCRWMPDDRTAKFLDRRRRKRRRDDENDNDVESGEDEWKRVLDTEVLQWTRSVRDSNDGCPMLRTRGVVDISPMHLRDLLLDCDRVRSLNKNLIHKENVAVLAPPPGISSDGGCVGGGEKGGTTTTATTTKIVRHVMKVPIVGSTIRGLTLTHSRRLEDVEGGYLIVSRSVVDGDSPTMEPANPYCSISVLRPVSDDPNKTELTNVARTSSMPIPKFLVLKVASMAAVDFFSNLRCLCKEG
jgi:hypothetical protein